MFSVDEHYLYNRFSMIRELLTDNKDINLFMLRHNMFKRLQLEEYAHLRMVLFLFG